MTEQLFPAPTIVIAGKTLPATEGFRPVITFKQVGTQVGGVREAIATCHELSRLVQQQQARAASRPDYPAITRSPALGQSE